jgi:hypothetical protein
MNKLDTNNAGTGQGTEPAGYQGPASSIHYRLAELEVENSRLHRLVAELLIKNQQLRKPG